MPERVIAALAIQTSGPDPRTDRLQRLRVAVSSGDGTKPLVAHAATGDAPDLARALAAIPEGAVWIADKGEHVHAFLDRALPDGPRADIIDTTLLGQICFPTEAEGVLRLPPRDPDPTAPGNDALAAACAAALERWTRIETRLATMPPALLDTLIALFGFSRRSPVTAMLKTARRSATAHTPAVPLRELFTRETLPPRRQLMLGDVRTPLDPEDVAAVFEPGGPLARALPGYEARPQQMDMTRAVASAFNDGRLLMAEAGTGVGKSLAYLVPAVMWASLNETPVIVSTSTKNLQSQLLEKDIPLLSRILRTEFKAVVIKGRRNYLCLRKLLFLLGHASDELDKNERAALGGVVTWAVATRTGDLAECAAASAAGDTLTDAITSAGGECQGPQCEQRTRCFLYRARRRALAADVVIANHAVVLAELHAGDESAVLPPHRQIILDEAHNLEEAATAAFSVEVSARRLRFLSGRLWRPGGRKGGHGLVPHLMRRFEAPDTACPLEVREKALKALREIVSVQTALWSGVDAFLGALSALMPTRSDRETLRLRADGRPPETWDPITEKKTAWLAALGSVAAAIDTVLEVLHTLEDEALDERSDFVRQLESIVGEIRGLMADVDFVLAAKADDHVYWIERLPPRHGGACAWAAPITVGDKLFDLLLSQKESVVLTSATLSVSGSLAYIRERLGVGRMPAERIAELTLGSPFEFGRQCLCMTPSFLPEPDDGQGGYVEALGAFLASLFRRTHGRALGLFTSYDMLTRTARVLRRELASASIPILVQGESGSREAILEAFRADGAAVLLGTHSFWEGVDVVGEALSCLVVARLPFAVFTDPIVEARCQQLEAAGQSAFMGLSVPNAVIKLRQGFGRLIRSRTDRGVVVIADRRIISRRYGIWFRNSLPVPVRPMPDREEMLSIVEQFLEGDPDA